MDVYCIEDLNIKFDAPRSIPTGLYEITKKGTQREIKRYVIYAETVGAGTIEKAAWYDLMKKCVEVSGQQKLLEKIKEYCKDWAWLNTPEKMEEYALEILAGRTYAIRARAWKDFPMDEVKEGQAFIFDFSKGW